MTLIDCWKSAPGSEFSTHKLLTALLVFRIQILKYDLPQIKTVLTCWEDGQSSDTRPFFEDQILSSFCCCFYSSESLCHKGQKEVNAQTVTTFNEPTLNCRIALIFCKHFTLIARFIFWHLIFLFGCKERPTTCVKLTLHYCCLTFQIVWILI